MPDDKVHHIWSTGVFNGKGKRRPEAAFPAMTGDHGCFFKQVDLCTGQTAKQQDEDGR
jgi:hypothetical protein